MVFAVQAIADRIFSWLAAPLFFLGSTGISVLLLLKLVLAIAIVLIIIRVAKFGLKQYVLARFKLDAGNREAIATVISYTLGAISFLIVVQSTGINLASLSIVLGALGVGIGFGLQNITNDFISGLTLVFERTLKVGDFVELDGLKGYIEAVKLRSTLIRTRDNGYVVVPNSQLVSNRVLNWSYDTFQARLKVMVGVAYGSDPVLVTETLLKSAYMEASILREPRPRVMFRGFGDNALNFELWFWVDQVDRDDQIMSSLYFTIEYNLRQAHISIPFPQRDLWLRNPEVLDWRSPATTPPVSPADPLRASPGEPLNLRHLLRSVDYFDDFTELELRQLIEIGYRRRLREQEVLFHEGDPGNAFYVVLSGAVEVVAERLQKQLSVLGAGQFFGEVSLLLGIPRTAMVRTLEPTTLFVIGSSAFAQMLQSHPELAEHIVQALGRHREELVQRQAELRQMGLVDRAEDDRNPVVWARNRLRKLFNLTAGSDSRDLF